MTGVSAEFNRRSRPFSWSIPAFILNTWRSSTNQTAPQLSHKKNNGEESLGNDYSFPLPLPDKDATLKDSEIAGSKGITGILQSINEEQPTINEPENDESMEDDVKPDTKNGLDSGTILSTGEAKLTHAAKQKHANEKPISKEKMTTSYSIPIDYKWNNNKTHSLNASNVIGADQKHISPIYIEIDDVIYKNEESENDSHKDVYSVPIDSINGNDKISANDRHTGHTGSPIRGKQAAKTTASLPVVTNTAQSSCKPQSIGGNGNSLPNRSVDDDEYSVPVDDINSSTLGSESSGHRIYTSPTDSPRMKNFSSPLNSPRMKKFNPKLEPSSPSNAEYSDPVATLSKRGNNSFASAVVNAQSRKKQKHKPVKPDPYKSSSTSSTLCNEDSPLYEEVLQTSATLPLNNGLHHNPFVPLDCTKMTASSQPVGLDEYTVPGTDKIALHKNPSYGDVCSTTEASAEYTYVPTNRLRFITPNMLQDVCTTYTEC